MLSFALLACTSAVALAAPAESTASVRDRQPRDPTWVARDFGRGADRSAGMALSPDGTTVFDAVDSSGQFGAAAHDAETGATRWAVHVDPMPDDLAEYAEAMAISPDGTKLFVTGDAEQGVDTRSVVTVALDTATGAVLWETRIDSDPGQQAIPNGIAIAPDGASLFVIAARTGAGGGQDFWDYMTAAFDASTGTNTWTSIFAGRAHAADIPRAVAVAPDGSHVFVTGTSIRPLTRRDFTTVAYDAVTGHREWVAPHGGLSDDYAGSLAVAPDGSIYVTGTIRAFTPEAEIQVLALDPSTGTPLHRHRFASPSEDLAQGIALSADGSTVVVVGESAQDFVTLAFSPALDPLWTATFDANGLTDVASAAAVSPDGAQVYVTGRSENGAFSCEGDVIGTVYATVAYEAATGAEQWVGTYSGSSKKDPDAATAIAVAPSGGAVFVSGTSDDGCKSAPDVATLAYAG
jgi:hypothetical protein